MNKILVVAGSDCRTDSESNGSVRHALREIVKFDIFRAPIWWEALDVPIEGVRTHPVGILRNYIWLADPAVVARIIEAETWR